MDGEVIQKELLSTMCQYYNNHVFVPLKAAGKLATAFDYGSTASRIENQFAYYLQNYILVKQVLGIQFLRRAIVHNFFVYLSFGDKICPLKIPLTAEYLL